MKAKEFSDNWALSGGELETFHSDLIKSLKVSEITKEYLQNGIPREAAPFLTFGSLSGATLQSAAEEYNLSKEYEAYKIIGFNAYGDPICIDENDSTIVYLNHDDDFGYIFLNSSIEQFAEFLLEFKQVIKETKLTPYSKLHELADATIKKLREIDSEAIKEGDWEENLKSFIN